MLRKFSILAIASLALCASPAMALPHVGPVEFSAVRALSIERMRDVSPTMEAMPNNNPLPVAGHEARSTSAYRQCSGDNLSVTNATGGFITSHSTGSEVPASRGSVFSFFS